jgi:hypothetical protein
LLPTTIYSLTKTSLWNQHGSQYDKRLLFTAKTVITASALRRSRSLTLYGCGARCFQQYKLEMSENKMLRKKPFETTMDETFED